MFIVLNHRCWSLLASVMCNQAVSKAQTYSALERNAQHALPILPMPGDASGTRVASPVRLSQRLTCQLRPPVAGQAGLLRVSVLFPSSFRCFNSGTPVFTPSSTPRW
ncbi:unnamed protein product [Rangifer tarandus platyrhynchus]|uniref:Uncharacterized protein n=1 Tax=Rangifer tarandus platyrhynchus TaxID=3082113 RepID=A0AC59YQK4_RANTA